MTVDIYIKEKSGKREIRIPILPENPSWDTGDTIFASYDIMGRGEVSVPTGTELEHYSWESEFPGEGRKNDPMIRGKWQAPKNYNSILHEWKRKGIVLNLMVIGYPINRDVLLKSYSAKAAGPFGDITYELEFVEYREIVIKTTMVAEKSAPKRPGTPTNIHIVKIGDTLWSIAQKFYGSGAKWQTIYNANKNIIEKTAKKHGRSSSDNGHWIYPGTVLTIPDNPGSTPTSSTAVTPTPTPDTTPTPTTTTTTTKTGGGPGSVSFGRTIVRTISAVSLS